MKTDTRNKIEQIIKEMFPIWVSKIANILWFSNEVVHRHLKKLILEWKIYKTWTPPKVYYFPTLEKKKEEIIILNDEDNNFLENNFLDFSPDWQLIYWVKWFIIWCEKRWLDIKKEIIFYKETIKKYNSFKDENWFIDWIQKLKQTFKEVYIDEIYYLDFYSIEKYWKTLLGNLMFYWKQNWDKEIISNILDIIKNPINKLVNDKNIDTFWFIPPSIDRKIQILTELKKWFNFSLNELKLIKIFRDKIVSQKSLSKTNDRILNAKQTIFIQNQEIIANKVLLIDDAVWSWSTLNETAKKIKEKWISNYVIWVAIVWSFKWFDIINEI